jgi:hypothetical protein
MAPKSKQPSSSAVHRREQARQQRQSNNKQSQGRRRRAARSQRRTSTWWLLGGIVVMVAIIIGIFIYLSRQPAPGTSTTGGDTAAVLKTITSVDPSLLAQVGTGNAQNLMKPVKNGSPLTGPNGKPEFFYAGGEFCPYCAAQRWAMIVALSRFGTFSNVTELTSSEGNYPTFTFHGSSYSSQYIDFVPVELTDNQHNPLDTPTAEQQQLFNTYDAPPYVDASSTGSIPFIDIGNKFVSAGSYYSPTVLDGLSWQAIATQIKDPNSDVAKGILGTANYLTAAICSVTNNQPTSVCTSAPIPQIEPTLPQAYHNGGSNGQMGIATGPWDVITPKRV